MKVFLLLALVLAYASAWTNTPNYIIARIAEKDLKQRDSHSYDLALAMLKPLNSLVKGGDYPF